MIPIAGMNDDASEFVALVEKVANHCVASCDPEAVFVVKIDNWFGENWLGFSGKALGAVGLWKTRLTVPPFVPNRVRDQWYYKMDQTTGGYLETQAPQLLHKTQLGHENLQRFLDRVATDAVIVWYSGTSEANGRGSLMAYFPRQGGYATWYIELACTGNGWSPVKVLGTSLNVVLEALRE